MIRTATRGWQAAEQIANAMRDRAPFRTNGSLGGAPAEYASPGWMPSAERNRLRKHERAGRIRYVVMSYGTPIAYLLDADPQPTNGLGDEAATWIVPDVTYSPTTSKHQGTIRHAIRVSGMAVRP